MRVGLLRTSGPRIRAQQVLQVDLYVALGELSLDRPTPELVGERKDAREHQAQLPRYGPQPRDLAPLRTGHSLPAPAHRLPAWLTTTLHAAEATPPATAPMTPSPQFAASDSARLMDYSTLSWLCPCIARHNSSFGLHE
jgi:hypothetical protein